MLVKDIYAGSSSSSPLDLTNVNGTLFFNARDANGDELWKSDGTEAGTVMVKDIYSGASSSSPDYLTNVNGTHGVELWLYRFDFGDLDNDGDVDFRDFALFALHWAETDCNTRNDWCGRADITDYGVVDNLDLGEFTEHWLEGTN